MAKKIYGVKEIAQDSDYVAPVVNSGDGPISLATIDSMAYFSYDDTEVTVTTTGANDTVYGVKVLDATDADDLAILKKLRNIPMIAMKVAIKNEAFDESYSKVEVLHGLANDTAAITTAIGTLKTDINAIYDEYGLPNV